MIEVNETLDARKIAFKDHNTLYLRLTYPSGEVHWFEPLTDDLSSMGFKLLAEESDELEAKYQAAQAALKGEPQ